MRLLSLGGLALLPFLALAQTEVPARLRYGISLGMTQTNVKITSDYPLQSSIKGNFAPGLRLGGMLSYSLSRRLFATAQLTYFRMVVDATQEVVLGNGFVVSGEVKQTNDWVELPLDIYFVFNPGSKIHLFAGAGASLMLLASSSSYWSEISDGNELNMGLTGQVGADIPVSNKILRLVLQADKTMNGVRKQPGFRPGPWDAPEYDYHYTTFTLKAAYLF